MSDEPEYLKALKRTQERQKAGGTGKPGMAPAPKGQSVTPAEREAHRWAREVGGKEVRIAASVSGAKVAFLVRPITPFGTPPVTLEGLQSREALGERIKSATGAGEEILGCFELTTGRPLTPDVQEGKVTFAAGAPREIMKAQSPERMIRLAAKQAEELAKTRKVDDRDKGGRGRR